MAKNIRQTQGQNVYDPSGIAAMEFNPAAGSQKVSEVGRALLPLKFISGGVVTYTTDASTARRLDSPGKCLAIYNPTAGALSVTLGSAVTAPTLLAAGATNASGGVGIPCTPNNWTYIACDLNVWVITSAGLFTFLIDDETNIKVENP